MRNWIQSFLYAPKHSKPTDENILQLLLPSFVGIILCMVCLAGSTWAWFTATIQTAPQTIEAAGFAISAALTGEDGLPVDTSQPLQAGRAYKVTLTASGTAPNGGYCKVEGGAAPLYTVPLQPGESFSFTLIPQTEAVYTFTSVWGSYSGEADITNGCKTGEIVESPSAPDASEEQQDGETVYVVQSGDSLQEIAKQYDTTVDKLVAYNDIENPGALQIGQEIKIPPADYEIPTESVTSVPDTTSSQIADMESSTPAVSGFSGYEPTQAEGESRDNSAGAKNKEAVYELS